jgi:hypothetical protein
MSKTVQVQEFSKEQLSFQIASILNFIITTKRHISAQSLAERTMTSVFLVNEVIEKLMTLNYIKPTLTPSGKLKAFTFNYSCQGLVFYTPYYVLYNGRLVEGSTLRTAPQMANSERCHLRYKDMAHNEGLKFVEYRLTVSDVASDLFVAIFVKSDADKAANAALKAAPIKLIAEPTPHIVDVFENFPFCKKEVELYTNHLNTLETQLQKFQDADKSTKAEFEKQTQLAQRGLRTKTVTDSRVVGQEDVYVKTVKSSSSLYGDSTDHIYETFNVYEHTHRQVVDFPKDPVYNAKVIEELVKEISTCQSNIAYIEKNLNYYEKRLKLAHDKIELKKDYDRKHAILNREYEAALRNLG